MFFQKDCAKNEVWNECGSACPTTCQTLGLRRHRYCSLQCVPRCECAKGLVRRTSDMECIPFRVCWK